VTIRAQPETEAPPDESGALLERLTAHRTLGSAPRAELAWLAARGRTKRFVRGETLVAKGEVAGDLGLWVIFSGHAAIYVDRGAGPKRVMEWRGGDVSGVLPYSRLTTSIGSGIALEDGELLMVGREHFEEMIRECPVVTAILVHVMLDRARVFTSSDLQDEKMLSLGKLAAGLAHELNNPASAAARGAKLLEEGLREGFETSRALGAARLSEAQMAALDRFRTTCALSATAGVRGPLEQVDQQDAVGTWLDEHDADSSMAASLVESGVTVPMLEELSSMLEPSVLNLAVRWVAADCSTRTLLSDVQKAATRIYDLVASVKRFTYMDRSAVPEPVDVAQALRDTIAVVRPTVRATETDLQLDLDESLPVVRAFGGELNQVWLNLIDNALDAVAAGGHVTVSARLEPSGVVVRVVDDGPGVPADLLDRIFDPFFTTKPVGQGTGLGLDIARRLVRRNGGEIDVDSRPGGGRTEFRVTLPALKPD
jgi:signal transduction histidine kinase